jgi:phosphate-selective porin OprO/OprP
MNFVVGRGADMVRALLLLACLASVQIAYGQVVDPRNVVIRNVHIATVGADEEPVNLLIRDNKLEIVTKDAIPTPEGVYALDAEGTFLIGILNLGETPSFIILDGDPRTDFDVLLDTETHTVFAVHEGELKKNRLLYAAGTLAEPEEEPRPRGWLAYTPPPMAIPTNYGNPDKWNQWETENSTGIFLAAIVLDRQHWPSQNSDSEQQVGDLELFEGGEIRGFRIGAIGALNYFERPWVYTIFGATNAFDKGFETERQDNFTWFDYRLDIPVSEGMTLSVGKQKEPISMERVMSMIQLPMQERTSVSDGMLPSRNFGAVLSGNAFEQRMSWVGGIFHNFIDSDDDRGSTPTQLIGRVTWVPWVSDDGSNLLHVGGGYRYSNGKQGAQYFTEPEFNNSPNFVDTGFIDADDINQVNLEASWRRGPYWVHAEYVGTDVDSPASGEPEFTGYHITGSWILTGEMRDYRYRSGIFGPVPVARSVYQGGWGAWELGARYSSIDLTDGLIDGGEMDIFSLGINWWLSPIFNVNLNYRFITNNKDGFSGETQGVMGRVLLMLE